jgi:hypothetical protein
MSRLFVPLEKFRKKKQSNVNQSHSQVEEETSFYYPMTRHVHFAAGKFEISQPIPTRIRCVFLFISSRYYYYLCCAFLFSFSFCLYSLYPHRALCCVIWCDCQWSAASGDDKIIMFARLAFIFYSAAAMTQVTPAFPASLTLM